MTNPFTPTFGMVPKLFLHSQVQPEEIRDRLLEDEQFPNAILISGVRGTGKTALMMRVVQLVGANKNSIHVALTHKEGMLDQLARMLYVRAHSRLRRAFDQLSNVSAAGFGLGRNRDGQAADVLVDQMLQEIQRAGKFVLVSIDEVSNDAAMRDLIQAYNDLRNQGYPIKVVMTGLPEDVLDVQEEKNLTFFLRADTYVTTPLDPVAMIEAYQETLGVDFALGERLAQITGGYSYAFQLLGDLLYRKQAAGATLNAALVDSLMPEFKLYLFNRAYQTIYKDGSERDRQYLRAIQGRKKTSEVIKLMGVTKNTVAKCRERALARQIVKNDGYGYVVYRLPYFGDFIRTKEEEDRAFI